MVRPPSCEGVARRATPRTRPPVEAFGPRSHLTRLVVGWQQADPRGHPDRPEAHADFRDHRLAIATEPSIAQAITPVDGSGIWGGFSVCGLGVKSGGRIIDDVFGGFNLPGAAGVAEGVGLVSEGSVEGRTRRNIWAISGWNELNRLALRLCRHIM
jgi:hypothetical protein